MVLADRILERLNESDVSEIRKEMDDHFTCAECSETEAEVRLNLGELRRAALRLAAEIETLLKPS